MSLSELSQKTWHGVTLYLLGQVLKELLKTVWAVYSFFSFCAGGLGIYKERSGENGLTGRVSALGLSRIEESLR